MDRSKVVHIISDGHFCEARQLERITLLIQSCGWTPCIHVPGNANHLINLTLRPYVVETSSRSADKNWIQSLICQFGSEEAIHAFGLTTAHLLLSVPQLKDKNIILDLSGLVQLSASSEIDRKSSLHIHLGNLYSTLWKRTDWITLLPRNSWTSALGLPPEGVYVIRDEVRQTPELTMEKQAGAPVILMPSTLNEKSGVDLFAHVARQTKSLGLSARFVLSGRSDIDDPDHIPVSTIKGWEDQGLIEWWDRMPMHEAIGQSDVIVFPTRGPIHHRALSQALSLGKPIVASEAEGMDTYVEENGNGFIVARDNARNMTEAIAPLLLDDNRRCRMGQVSRTLFKNRNPQDQLENYERILEELYSGQREEPTS